MENPDQSKVIRTVGSIVVLAFLGYNLWRTYKYFYYKRLDPYSFPIVKREYRHLTPAQLDFQL